ncbi:hypothetical protein PRIPAC_83989 [Pristionchus pacificus]|uniref:Uncharacterized protein n=1 Tax=Pristionchus pacificus TaxID=54126 RepID=A0A2A6BKY3_PRIPA|nr:hypothetical protein PRIPAC_83989 [Pristionchus pacificus]|eukprot:PDM66569.1 hypothetical protein PRIPAC_47986 [Pristionchus pacificus]
MKRRRPVFRTLVSSQVLASFLSIFLSRLLISHPIYIFPPAVEALSLSLSVHSVPSSVRVARDKGKVRESCQISHRRGL